MFEVKHSLEIQPQEKYFSEKQNYIHYATAIEGKE